jgi:hypothetical protein
MMGVSGAAPFTSAAGAKSTLDDLERESGATARTFPEASGMVCGTVTTLVVVKVLSAVTTVVVVELATSTASGSGDGATPCMY